MPTEPTSYLLTLALLWFVLFWTVGGVVFAVVGLVRFLRLNKNRFSCLFTILSAATAFGAAWMGLLASHTEAPSACLAQTDTTGVTKFIPSLFTCASEEVLSAAAFWFLFLLGAGIIVLFISRAPERPRDIHGND